MGPVGPRWAHVGPMNLAIRGDIKHAYMIHLPYEPIYFTRQSRWSGVKPERLQCFIGLFPTNSLIKLFHIPGPMSCPYTKQSKTHVSTYPSILPNTGCAKTHVSTYPSMFPSDSGIFYWLWHVLVRESCLVIWLPASGAIVTCTVALESTTAPLGTRDKAALQTSYNCVLTTLCGLN